MDSEAMRRLIELRRIVDVLYDVQDVRTRTENRLRQMPAESEIYVKPLKDLETELTKRIDVMLPEYRIYTEFLKPVRGIGPRLSGCIISQTMIRFAEVSLEEFADAIGEHDPDLKVPIVDEPRFNKHQLLLSQKGKSEEGEAIYLVPTVRGIGAFANISKYWAWWGLSVDEFGSAVRPRKGEPLNYNPKMKVVAWKIAKQFVMQGLGYRALYDQKKDQYTAQRMPHGKCHRYAECMAKLKKAKRPSCQDHINRMSRRYAVKIFISHLWAKWRIIEGLSVTKPYPIDKLGHTTEIKWIPPEGPPA